MAVLPSRWALTGQLGVKRRSRAHFPVVLASFSPTVTATTISCLFYPSEVTFFTTTALTDVIANSVRRPIADVHHHPFHASVPRKLPSSPSTDTLGRPSLSAGLLPAAPLPHPHAAAQPIADELSVLFARIQRALKRFSASKSLRLCFHSPGFGPSPLWRQRLALILLPIRVPDIVRPQPAGSCICSVERPGDSWLESSRYFLM